MEEKSKVLIDGKAGFIGSHLVECLLGEGHPVKVVDDLTSGCQDEMAPSVRFIGADIRDRSKILEILSKESPGTVIHLAGRVHVRRSLAHLEHGRDAIEHGSHSVFTASGKCGIRRVITASSGGALDGGQPRTPFRETDTTISGGLDRPAVNQSGVRGR